MYWSTESPLKIPCRSQTLGRPQDIVCWLGVSYDNLLNYNVYYPKMVANHGSFIPLKYSLIITQHLQGNNPLFMIYEVYTTYVHYQETQIKKWTFLYFLKIVNFSNDSFTVIWNTVNLFPKFIIVPTSYKTIIKTYSTHFEIKFRVKLDIFSVRHNFLKISNI